MTKRIVSVLLLLYAGVFVFAGDAASFVDMGFSSDGNTYIFGQYGKTDKKFQAYAEIYTVDVAQNDFVPGGIFISPLFSATENKSSLTVFEELRKKNVSALNMYNCTPVSISQKLYLRENETKPPAAILRFEDFERITDPAPVIYEVRLAPSFSGSGKNIQSSFEIIVDIKDQAENLLEQIHAGNPRIKRKGVSGYAITQIYTDKSGKNLVFVVEKTIVDDTGISIRYMVETLRRK
ncbi:MAG: DUF2259 domain-containing protein [Treponema sp.]|jgi:predicted secreted protein|nr:DUF2259 domain-containing protein [Treponema sp.]